jgi:hypothetical protein
MAHWIGIQEDGMELRYGLADSAMRLQVAETGENSPSDSPSTHPTLKVLSGGMEHVKLQDLDDPWFDAVTGVGPEKGGPENASSDWMAKKQQSLSALGDRIRPVAKMMGQAAAMTWGRCKHSGIQIGTHGVTYVHRGFTGLGTGCVFVYRRIGKSFVWFYERFQQQKLARSMALNDRWFESSVEVGLTRDPLGMLCVALPLIVCATTTTGLVLSLLS